MRLPLGVQPNNIALIHNRKTGRVSSWDTTGRNNDAWTIEPGATSVLADIRGPGQITHIWLTQPNHYRECLIRITWDNNYVIMETKGRGHYLGCNLSVTNFRGNWWGEGDDMIWVDGYKWPPDLHGTGSEDYLNQAWGMQDNAFMRNGSSIFEGCTTRVPTSTPWGEGAYQTSYVFHVENPVRFQREIKVTIEHGHGNHLANEMSSVGYWYAMMPTSVAKPPPVAKRMPVLRDNQGNWLYDKRNQIPGKQVPLNAEMRRMKAQWQKQYGSGK